MPIVASGKGPSGTMSKSLHPTARAATPQNVAVIEAAMSIAWTGANSTPFLAATPLDFALRSSAEQAIRGARLSNLFLKYPTLATWGVLTPLVRNYGADREVYSHITDFTGERFDDLPSRDVLKLRYRHAARRLGLPVDGNDPTSLFFAPLGPAHAQHGDLARAFVSAALELGPPAIEDTPSARSWQRRAVETRCPGHARLRATVIFDQSAWLATRFDAWRNGATAMSEDEGHLFAAYAAATAAFGRRRTDIVGPPRLYWTGYSLAFEPEATDRRQSLHIGSVPTPLAGGQRAMFRPPWPASVVWSCGGAAREIPAGPGVDDVLVFDEASGALIARLGPDVGRVELSADRHVIMARRPFVASSFGTARAARDPDCFIAWTEAGDRLVFEGRRELELARPVEAALWIEAPVLGRNLSRPLYAADGRLHLRINPDIGGSIRIIRARMGDAVHYAELDAGSDGLASMAFSDLGLGASADPARVVFEALAPGAAGDLKARAELSVAAWIWPGLDSVQGGGDVLPAPSTFQGARSAGLRRDGALLFVDPRAETAAAILGLQDGDVMREFHLSVRGDRLWHVRLATRDQILVPRGAQIALGHANRHDTLTIRSGDRDADLIVLGETIRRPFFNRTRYDIGAATIERGLERGGDDDRIALRRKDGRHDLLARLIGLDDPADIGFGEDARGLWLSLVPRSAYDALMVRIETALGEVRVGAEAFSHNLVDAPPLPPGVAVNRDYDSGRITIRIACGAVAAPGLARFFIRDGSGDFSPLLDADGAALALGLAGAPLAPDGDVLFRLAQFLAEPAPIALGGQVEAVLGPHYAAALSVVGAGMVTRVKRVVGLGLSCDRPPRHDLIGVAPWIFEASPFAFCDLPESSFLAPLSSMRAVGAPADLPDPRGHHPLVAWLDRLGVDPDPTPGLGAAQLAHAFLALRYRLRETDLRLLVAGPDAAAATQIAATYVEALDRFRAFDHAGGGDDRAARLAAVLDRFARACALKETAAFLDRIAFRTGLPPRECGRILTLMLRAGAEIFAYFRILWHHAAADLKAPR